MNTWPDIFWNNDKCYIKKEPKIIPYFSLLPRYLYDSIHQSLKPLAEDWTGIELEKSSIYGIRRYLNNAKLMGHTDRKGRNVLKKRYRVLTFNCLTCRRLYPNENKMKLALFLLDIFNIWNVSDDIEESRSGLLLIYVLFLTLGTHVISGIVNVGQDVNEPWPLQILDHQGNVHHVTLEPGDLLWYESEK